MPRIFVNIVNTIKRVFLFLSNKFTQNFVLKMKFAAQILFCENNLYRRVPNYKNTF